MQISTIWKDWIYLLSFVLLFLSQMLLFLSSLRSLYLSHHSKSAQSDLSFYLCSLSHRWSQLHLSLLFSLCCNDTADNVKAKISPLSLFFLLDLFLQCVKAKISPLSLSYIGILETVWQVKWPWNPPLAITFQSHVEQTLTVLQLILINWTFKERVEYKNERYE